MMAWLARVCTLVAASLLAGCYAHSFPKTDTFIYPASQSSASSQANVAEVFVDANGTFYPNGWSSHFTKPNWAWERHSLLNEARDKPAFRQLIVTDEARQLRELADFGRDKQRIFILVHGYNNSVDEALPSFLKIEKELALGRVDGVVRFYWDGLTADGPWAFKIWFNAAGYSQLAGSRGLRQVLNQFSGKTIYLIGHSRGTSVILSALGNPIYDPRFISQTRAVVEKWGSNFNDFLRPPPLVEQGNNIHVLVMAPAVDFIDFCDPSQQPYQGGAFVCRKLRPLSEQVKSFRYTVNEEDWVLEKIVGLGGNLNPTRFGLYPGIGEAVAPHYPDIVFKSYVFTEPQSFHQFHLYVGHRTFKAMLHDARQGERRTLK